jgi:hypothetical protein
LCSCSVLAATGDLGVAGDGKQNGERTQEQKRSRGVREERNGDQGLLQSDVHRDKLCQPTWGGGDQLGALQRVVSVVNGGDRQNGGHELARDGRQWLKGNWAG